jgi:hypothetical protein
MNGRKDFLTAFFRSLDAKEIRWCVLRNYEGLLDEGATADVDLLVDETDLSAFNDCLQSAAAETGQRFVHHARYVNHSRVFWNEESRFTRIDFDTEIRWRLFPMLTARVILDARQKRQEFHVPHPRHEATVLFVQALWMGKLDQRYREQLARLYVVCGDKEELRKIYREAFGGAGDELTEFHADISRREFTASFCGRLKRSIVKKTLVRPAEWREFMAYALGDMRRLWERLRQPVGISLLFASSIAQEKDLEVFMQQIEFLFPAQKCCVYRIGFEGGETRVRGKIGRELARLRVLFKGGLFVEFYRLGGDADLPKVLRAHSRRLYASRCFICTEDSKGRACLEHVGTGLRSGGGQDEAADKPDLSTLLINFISTVLEREKRREISAVTAENQAL